MSSRYAAMNTLQIKHYYLAMLFRISIIFRMGFTTCRKNTETGRVILRTNLKRLTDQNPGCLLFFFSAGFGLG